jgi:hypothetical protein
MTQRPLLGRVSGVKVACPLVRISCLLTAVRSVATSFVYGVTLNLNSVNQLIFVMVKCGVLFEVRTGFLNNI